MSDAYDPDEGAKPSTTYSEILLSQRDVSLPVPINFVTGPGVSLSAACFGNGVFEELRFGKCFSNLISVGFRRFELDLYWDERRRLWSFCPVAMTPSELDYAPPKASLAHSSRTFAEMSQASIPGETKTVAASPSPRITGSGTPSSEVQPKESLVLLGNYSCSAAATLATFSSQLLDYIVATQNTLDAHLTYYTFNIHAAAAPNSTASPAPSPSALPSSELLIGNILNSKLSAYIYTPVNLAHNRGDLNSSWFTVPERYRPITDYYSISKDENEVWSTEDGWPSESFIEFSTSKRALLQFGTIDPQMQGVNYSSDLEIIFPSGYIERNGTNLSFNSTGLTTNSCYLHNATTNVSSNSSWATVSLSNSSDFIVSRNNLTSIDLNFNLTSQLTDCGISPFLNTTLNNVTADIDFTAYGSLATSTIWSWAPGEPKSYNSSASPSRSGSVMRCTTTSSSGRWAVADCTRKHYAACRAAPYNWTISANAVSFSLANTACPTNYTFSTPASALENAYLTQVIRSSSKDFTEDKLEGAGVVLLAFNSINVPGCWVAGHENTTCPYSSESATSFVRERTIVVPTVAVIIILVVSAATLFAKGVGNRRGLRKRIRRKARNGFVYEGVPS